MKKHIHELDELDLFLADHEDIRGCDSHGQLSFELNYKDETKSDYLKRVESAMCRYLKKEGRICG